MEMLILSSQYRFFLRNCEKDGTTINCPDAHFEINTQGSHGPCGSLVPKRTNPQVWLMEDQCSCGSDADLDMTVYDMVKRDLSCGHDRIGSNQICTFTREQSPVKAACPEGVLMPTLKKQMFSPWCRERCDTNKFAKIHQINCWQNDADGIESYGCLNRQGVSESIWVSGAAYFKKLKFRY